jgi:hypothetical protein
VGGFAATDAEAAVSVAGPAAAADVAIFAGAAEVFPTIAALVPLFLAASIISMITTSGTAFCRSAATAVAEVAKADLDDLIFVTMSSLDMPTFTN